MLSGGRFLPHCKTSSSVWAICYHHDYSGSNWLNRAPILTLYTFAIFPTISKIWPLSAVFMLLYRDLQHCFSAPRLGKLGDRIGPERILIAMLIFSILVLIPMAFVQSPWQLLLLRFLLGAADGALLPAVQTLLIYNCSNQVAGRIFGYNQSFRGYRQR